MNFYLNVGDALSLKGRVEGSHGRDKVTEHVMVTPVKNLTTDKNVFDFCLRDERLDVVHHPLPRRINIRQRRYVAVRCRNRNGDAAVRERAEDIRVHVEDLHAVDDCFRL